MHHRFRRVGSARIGIGTARVSTGPGVLRPIAPTPTPTVDVIEGAQVPASSLEQTCDSL